MPPVSVPIELSDAEVSELAVWSEFFGMTQAELVAEAVSNGLLMRRAEYEYEQHPHPPGPPSDKMDDDIEF